MTEDEIAVMDGGKCILQLRGVRPFFSDKFDITKHPKYKYLPDADPKNAFAGARLLFATAEPHIFEAITAVFSCAYTEFTTRGKTVLPSCFIHVPQSQSP